MQNKINPPSFILTASSMKQLSMICKINRPFKAVQFVVKKSLSAKFMESFRDKCEKSGSIYVYVNQEYDGSERYILLYPLGVSFEFFPKDDDFIWLL